MPGEARRQGRITLYRSVQRLDLTDRLAGVDVDDEAWGQVAAQ